MSLNKNMKKILYFGYGANRGREMMEAVTGNKNLKGQEVNLKGWELCVQRIGQVPDFIAKNSPVLVSPRDLLKENWPDSFESYIIRPSMDSHSEVVGTLWELTPLERELVRDWELIDFGWYKDQLVTVETQDGKYLEVQTEVLREGQEIDRVIDGKNYETYLNDIKDFRRVVDKARREFFERHPNI